MQQVLQIFEKLTQIPHGSRNEKALSDFAYAYAKERGLEAVQDEAWNVLIRVPATSGYEQSPPVILQGHLDMVCEKTADSAHNFERDPLRLVYEGDFLRAADTTLGADDGVALAYGLALLDAHTPHPPLELLFTVEEECSMKGVKSFDPAFFRGRRLINIDSETDDAITVSCAGGMSLDYRIPAVWLAASGDVFTLTVEGLQGGHSGAEVHKERGNANKMLCRVLASLTKEAGAKTVSIEGGTKSNAIPTFARAELLLQDEKKAQCLAEGWNAALKKEYATSDAGVSVRLQKTQRTADRVLDEKTLRSFLTAILLTPSGAERRDLELGIVLSSRNVSVFRTGEDALLVECSLRGATESLIDDMYAQMSLLADTLGIEVRSYARYPGWEYQKDSALRETAAKSFQEVFGKEPKLLSIHAGLEIGYLAQRLPGLDAISIGPNVAGAHTPLERLSLSSFENIYRLLTDILANLRV